MQIGPFRGGNQPLDCRFDHVLQARIVVDAAIGGEDALMFAQHRGSHRGGIGLFRRRGQ